MKPRDIINFLLSWVQTQLYKEKYSYLSPSEFLWGHIHCQKENVGTR